MATKSLVPSFTELSKDTDVALTCSKCHDGGAWLMVDFKATTDRI